jgi:methionyl-tRNA synthetase
MTKDPFYITTPIYYVNDSPHIGHAYTTIACDVMARFMRLDGREVFFLTGTDEHGQKVAKSAANAGVDPQSFTDEVSQRFRALVGTGENILNVSNDDFIRTTEPRHKKACQELWKRIAANKTPKGNPCIYKDTYGGWYAVRDEAYYAESELTLKDGKKIAPSGAEAEWVEEESYFFRLSDYQDALLELYSRDEPYVLPETRLNEVKSFVAGGLKDLSISRTTFDWGVKVPGDEKHVMYVWIDALTNYLTAAGFGDETKQALYHKFWDYASNPPNDGRHPREGGGPANDKLDPRLRGDSEPGRTFHFSPCTHVVGKDILRFHAVYWPAFLMAAQLPLPNRIVAHGWWTIEGEKMSKSLGNVLSPQDMITQAGGVDQLRYFMLRAMPFGNDGDFSRERMIETINADLANNIGNLAQRTLSMIQKNCGGVVPEYPAQVIEADKPLFLDKTHEALKNYKAAMQSFSYQEALQAITELGSAANGYIDQKEPWALKKTDPVRMGQVLYVLAETARIIAIMLQPFAPQAATKILDQLVVPQNQRSFAHLTAEFALKPGTPLPAPEGVFPRLMTEKKGAA